MKIYYFRVDSLKQREVSALTLTRTTGLRTTAKIFIYCRRLYHCISTSNPRSLSRYIYMYMYFKILAVISYANKTKKTMHISVKVD